MPRVLKRTVALSATVVVTVVGALAVAFLRTDWDGTPYHVINSCSSAIYIDNGRDGLRLEPDESVHISGFGDLDLQIGAPGGPLEGAQTFETSPVDVAGQLCPQ